jgi:hypothetical protein
MASMEIETPLAPLTVNQEPVADVAKDALSTAPAADEAPKKRHQVSKACQHCAASHLSCNDHRPCERCVKRGLNCEERPRKRRNIRAQDIARFGILSYFIFFSLRPTAFAHPVSFLAFSGGVCLVLISALAVTASFSALPPSQSLTLVPLPCFSWPRGAGTARLGH